MKGKFYLAIGALVSLALGGCGFGLRVPELQEAWDSPDDGDLLIREISKTVYLSIEKAVVCVVHDDTLSNPVAHENFSKKWGVQATLQLTILESTTLNPGLSLNTPMHDAITNFNGQFLAPSPSPLATMTYPFVSTAQNYSLGFGGKASSQATRTETSGAFFSVEAILKNANKSGREAEELQDCNNNTIDEEARDNLYRDTDKARPSKTAQFLSLIVNNDLKIQEWLKSALHIQTLVAAMGGGAAVGTGLDRNTSAGVGQNAITHEVQFVVVTDGNVTPSWKLVRVSANQSSTLFDTQRQRTHDLIVTFGPIDPKGGRLQDAAKDMHSAALYGLSNVNGIRGVINQP